MVMNRAMKFRIYPNQEQRILFAKTFGCTRFIWNHLFADRIQHFEETGEVLNNTPAQYKDQYPWLREIDSLALANTQLDLNQAFQNHKKNPAHFGFPTFKAKHRTKKSYTTNNQKGSIRIEGKKIRLPKVGFVPFAQHRVIPDDWSIKSVTITETPTGKYFVSILFAFESQEIEKKEPKKFVGLDFSMHELYMSSEGKIPSFPHFCRLAEEKLAWEQRKLSHCVLGSKNYRKQRRKVALCHEKVANQRRDFLHKRSRELVDNFDMVAIEDLNMQGMSRALHFGKSVHDNGWGMFTAFLSYKLEEQGKCLVRVDKFFPSSQLCHVCGYKNPETKNLDVREWTCPSCHVHHDRDCNAAINIREEGKRILFSA